MRGTRVILGAMFTIAIAQTEPSFLDVPENHARAMELIRSVRADLYLFPELYLSGYAFSTRQEVERCGLGQENPYFEELSALSRERGIAICGGYAEKAPGDNGTFYNSAFLIGDGALLANYRKTHLFYREHDFFAPGDTGFIVTEYRGVRLGLMVCFDWIYPESARTLALRGAQVILHPSNLVLPYCQRAMFARAVENRVFVATANRVGREDNAFGDDLTFTGGSQVVTPEGTYVLTFDEEETGIRAVTVDPAEADGKQLNAYDTILHDLRPEMYTTQSSVHRSG